MNDLVTTEWLAAEIGARAGTSTPREAVALADVAAISVPWRLLDEVLEQLGSLDGKIVVDTTNQYGAAGPEDLPIGRTAAQVNAERMPGARYTKSFNTLTSAFQAEAAGAPVPIVPCSGSAATMPRPSASSPVSSRNRGMCLSTSVALRTPR